MIQSDLADLAGATILSFPPRPKTGPVRLQRAVEGLEQALADQHAALADFRAVLSALKGATQGLRGSMVAYRGELDTLQHKVAALGDEAGHLAQRCDQAPGL
jgi:hypothetical protein